MPALNPETPGNQLRNAKPIVAAIIDDDQERLLLVKRLLQVRPGVLRIATLEFLPYRGIVPLPEAGEIAGYLDRAAIGRKQMNCNRHPRFANGRCRRHSKKVLQSGFDPGRFRGLVMDLDRASCP
jgi:hypothetical protein